MATEKLVVQLESDTAKLRADLDKVDDKLNNVDKSTVKTDKSMNAFSITASGVATAITAVAAGVAAAVTAMSAVIISTAKTTQEMANFATTAKTSVENFKALSFAMEQYGVDTKGTADAMNDVSERLGEFSKAGSGAFQDFADVMNMTKEDAQKFAAEIKHLSGEDAILEMVRRMDEANVSGAEMSFVMKSMSNDLEYASAAFADGGKKLKDLKQSFNDATTAMKLTSAEAEIMQSTAVSFSLATKTLSQSATVISAQLAPEFESFFNYVIEKVPNATQGIVDFLNSMKSTESITNMESINGQIRDAASLIQNLVVEKKALEGSKVEAGAGSGGAQGAGIIEDINRKAEEGIALVNKRMQEQYELLNELGARKSELATEQAEVDAKEAETIDAQSKLMEEAASRKASILADDKKKQLDELANRFKSEEELLTAKYEKEQELAVGNKDLMASLEAEYIDNLNEMKVEKEAENRDAERDRYFEYFEELGQEKFDAEIAEQQRLLEAKLINEEDYLKSVYALGAKYGKMETKEAKKKSDDKEGFDSDYADAALQIGESLFEGSKAIEAGLVVAKTGAAVMHQLGSGDPYTAFARAAAAGAVGAVQLAQTLGASKGGGSITTPSGTSAPQENTSRFSSSVEINETVAGGGSTSNTLTVRSDSSSDGELGSLLAAIIDKKIKSGEITLG